MESHQQNDEKKTIVTPYRRTSAASAQVAAVQAVPSCHRAHSNSPKRSRAAGGRLRLSPRRPTLWECNSQLDQSDQSLLTSDELLKVAAVRSQSGPLPRISTHSQRAAPAALPGAYSEAPGATAARRIPCRYRSRSSSPEPSFAAFLSKEPTTSTASCTGTTATLFNEALDFELTAISARLVIQDDAASCRLQEIENRVQAMGSRMSCSSACTVSSDLTLYSSDEEDMDMEDEEEASIPEARPIASTGEDPEMLERVSQLEQEMKRLQDELRQQQQQNLKQQSAQPFKFRQPSSELASSSEESPNTATIDDQIAHAQFVQAFRASIKVKNRKYHLKKYKNCFVGREAVDVLVQLTGKSRTEALVMGINLGVNLFEHVRDPKKHPVLEDNYVFFRFVSH